MRNSDWVIREEQANWFLDTLASTPDGYSVVVAMHEMFSRNLRIISTSKFTDVSGYSQETIDNYDAGQNQMETDFFADAVEAFINKTVYSANVVAGEEFDYMNTETDAEGNKYMYSVSKDFSDAVGSFLCYIGGHVHRDIVLQHKTYDQQYQVIASKCNVDAAKDIATTTDLKSVASDSFDVLSFADGKIGLVRIGQNVTKNGTYRDVEVISVE